MIKRILVILIFTSCITFIAKGWHVFTGGFKTNKIVPPKDCVCEEGELGEKDLLYLFDQEFKFLDKGCQVYVFESQDKKYVIKFLRHHKYKPPFWLDLIDWTSKGKKYKEKIENYKKSRVKNAFSSYVMAFKKLKEETSLCYLHLKRTDYNKKIKVIDKMGQKWILDLDELDFIIQKRVNNLSNLLLKLSKDKKIEKAKSLIDGYFKVVAKRCLKGIKNVDHSGYIRNMGYLEDKVFEMDVGGYRKNEDLKTKEGFVNEFMYFSSHFRRWAKKRAPNLKQSIDEKSNKILCQSLEKL